MNTASEHTSGHGVVPVKYYVGVFAALIVLTITTVYTAKYVDLGNFNFLLAMVIATVKAVLVFAIFMGVYWDKSRFHIVIIMSAFLFFAIFMGITALDIVTRGSIYADEALEVNTQTKVRVEGYFEDIPEGGDISKEAFLKLKTESSESEGGESRSQSEGGESGSETEGGESSSESEGGKLSSESEGGESSSETEGSK